jgi:hypothetical protein
MTLGRRTLFFLILGVICLVMIPPTPSEFRALNVGMAFLAFFWAVALALEDLANARTAGRRGRPDANGPVTRA